MTPEHQTESELHAWLDNEISGRERAAIHEHVQSCNSCLALLAECRETRATVSSLLQSYDSTFDNIPRRASCSVNKRAELQQTASDRPSFERSMSDRIPFARSQSAPLIGHIVANSQPVKFWTGARTLLPVAAAALLFVGSATLFMARSYHVVAGSVKSFANDTQIPFVNIDGQVLTLEGAPIANATVSVAGKGMRTLTDASGNFKLLHVPRTTQMLVAKGIGFSESSLPFTSGNGDVLSVQFRLTRELRRLNPVRITLGDSVDQSKPPSSDKRR